MRTFKKIKGSKLFLIGYGAVAFLSFGCSKSNPLNPAGNCFGGNWAAQYSGELQAWSDAAKAFTDNPTAENCTDYKNAAKNYFDALSAVYECIPTASRADIDKELAEAKADIDNESCDN